MQPLPLYYQVKENLMEKINKKIYQIGDVIPSEAELQAIYKVSRITIRRAIQELVQEGYLSTQQGKGTFVSQPKATQQLNLISSWAETMTSLGLHPQTKTINFSEEPAPIQIASELGIEPGSAVYKMERLRYASNEPISIMINYIVPEVAPDLMQRGLISESLYETLEKVYNITLKTAVEKVEARAATSSEANLLNVKRGAPLLYVTRITYDSDDKPIEIVQATSRADRYSYTVKLSGRAK
jgi:GntR family transcriptional regulator